MKSHCQYDPSTIPQCPRTGLADELHLDIVPVVLNEGLGRGVTDLGVTDLFSYLS